MAADDAGPASLESLRADAARRLAERAGDPAAQLAELHGLHERLRLLDAALAARPAPARAPRHTWPPALWPALAVALLLSLAAALPVPAVPFTLELRAQAATLQFDAAGTLEAQPVHGELRIEGYTRLESPAPALGNQAAAHFADGIVLHAPHLSLRRVVYPAGTALSVSAGRHVHLAVDAPVQPLAADVEFAGRTAWRLGGGGASDAVELAHAEWLRVRTDEADGAGAGARAGARAGAGAAGAGVPGAAGGASATGRPAPRPPLLELWLGRGEGRSFTWDGLRPSALQFVARRAGGARGGEPVVASSIQEAQIVLPATGGQVRLGAGDRLELEGLALERFDMTAGDSVSIRLGGTARVLATRTGDFERSLKPSVLEYVARHHTVSLFWSSALVLWGAIAWVRKQFDTTPR